MNKFKKGSIALAVSLLAISSIAQAQTYVIMHPSDSISTNSATLNEAVANARNTETDDSSDPDLTEEERLSAWEQFAEDNDLPYSDWNTTSWGFKGLGNLPAEPYPVSNPYELIFKFNGLTNVDGLSSVITVDKLYLGRNALTDISALKNLVEVQTLELSNNYLSDLSGLQNLTSAYNLYLNSNYLSDISDLQNLTSVNILYLHDNDLSNLTGLENLTSVYDYLYLQKNNLSNLSELQNLTSVRSLDVRNNNLNDISAIANTEIEKLEIDGSYDGIKLSYDSLLCERLRSGNTDLSGAEITDLCESS